MKKTIALIGLPLVVIIAFVTWGLLPTTTKGPVTNLAMVSYHYQQKTIPLHIVAIGDSLTQGIGDPKKLGYAGDTTKLLKKDPLYSTVTLKNYGVHGYTTDDLLNKVLNKKDVIQNIQQAQIIFMTVGGNDMLNVIKKNFLDLKVSEFSSAEVHYDKNFQIILKQLHKTNPRATIYYLGLYNPFQDYLGNIQEFNTILTRWNKSSQTIISTYPNVVYVPTVDIFAGKTGSLFYKDHLHPNPAGYHLMSQRLYQYMTQK